MVWTALSGFVPQYQKSNGDLASGFYIKFYTAGTSTAINMATDSTGGTLLAKTLIDSSGYPNTAGGAVFIPHLEEDFKISLYPTEADADADTNSEWDVDDLKLFSTTGLAGAVAGTEADLKAITGQVTEDIINLLGKDVLGDDGGGLFYFDSTSAAADDDATIYQPDVGSGRWLRKYDVSVKPEWWGAKRDGSTDDTSALQACATFAEDNKFTMLLSNGSYNFSSTLIFEDRISIRGQNKEDTKLAWVGGASIAVHLRALFAGGDDSEECWLGHFSILNEGTGTIGLQIDPSYTTLDHFRCYHSGSNVAFSTAMVQTDRTVNVNQLKCYNIEIRGDANPGGAMGFHFARGSNSVFHGGTFSSFQTCLKIGDVTTNGNECTNVDVSGGILFETQGPFQTTGSIGLHVDGASGIHISGRFEFGAPNLSDALGILLTNRLRGCVITRSDFFGSGQALNGIIFGDTSVVTGYEDATSVEIFGNSFLSIGSATTHVIDYNGAGKLITGATQTNPVVITSATHPHANGDEVTMNSVGGMSEINGRKFIIANSTTNTYELSGEDGTSHTAYTSGGQSTRFDNPNINIGTNSMVSIGGNLAITDPAFSDQDATPSVATGNFFVSENTIATTITDLDGVPREQEKEVTIVFDDANTTVDFTGTALKGNNGVDWTPAAGDFMTCQHRDGAWYCTIGEG